MHGIPSSVLAVRFGGGVPASLFLPTGAVVPFDPL